MENVMLRDRIDSTREAAPLRQAPDAKEIDSTKMSIEEVVQQAEAIVDAALAVAEEKN